MAIASSSQNAAPGPDMDPLEQLATTNTFSIPWSELHARLLARLNTIIDYFPTSPPSSAPPPEPQSVSPRSSPVASSSDLNPSTIGGLIIPPFPPLVPGRRKSASPITSLPSPPSPGPGRGNGLVRANGHLSMMANRAISGNLFEDTWDPEVVIGGKMLPGLMSREDGKKEVERVAEIMKDMEGPPFTLQRLAELLHDPRKQHSNLGRFLRALEKNLLVTSPYEPPSYNPPPPLLTNMPRARDDTMPPGSATPMFSPIPFLPATHPGLAETAMPNGGGKIEEGLMSPLTLDHGFASSGRSPTPEPEGALGRVQRGEGTAAGEAAAGAGTAGNGAPTATNASDPAHQPYLGRVDELDTGPLPPGGVNGDAPGTDESGGGGEGGNMTLHGMSDRPVPISGTMSPESERRIAHMPSRRSLVDRFVSGGSGDDGESAPAAEAEEGDAEMGGSQESA